MTQPAELPAAGQDGAPAGPTRGLSRRALLRRGGFAGMALLLSACSAPAPSPPAATTGAPTPTSPPKPAATGAAATSAPAAAVSTTAAPAGAATSGTMYGGVLLTTYVPSTL